MDKDVKQKQRIRLMRIQDKDLYGRYYDTTINGRRQRV